MILRLEPPLPVEANGRKALAYAWIDYGVDHDLIWLVAYDDNRTFWCVKNQNVRAIPNETYLRTSP